VLNLRDYLSDSGVFKARMKWALGWWRDVGAFICFGICACER